MKKFIAGLIIGLMLTSTVSFAANQDISAVLTNFNFVVNGQAKTISTQPIAYNGTSYLPVRELSNLLGYEVTYNEVSRTIMLTNQSQSEPSSSFDASDSTTPPDGFISLRTLYDTTGINTLWGGDEAAFFKGSVDNEKKLNFDHSITGDGTYSIDTIYGSFTLKIVNSRAYIRSDEILSLFQNFDQ